MFKTTLCNRCKCQFQFDSEQFRFRKYCDPCEPIHKKEMAHTAARRRTQSFREVRKGWLGAKDPFESLIVRSYADVAKLLGCSAEAVRQIETRALSKARKLLQFDMLAIRTAQR